MAFKGILLACLLFIGAALAQQTGSVEFTGPSDNADVGTWTDRAFITLSEFPVTQLTLVVDTLDDGLVIEPTTFTFTPTIRSLSYRAYSEVDTESLSVTFRKSDDPSDQFLDPSGYSFVFENRTIDIDAFPDTYVGLPSEPMKIVLSTAPESDLQFVPQLDNYTAYISFTPNPIVVRAGSRLATFTWISSIQLNGADDLKWTINGAQNVVSRYVPATSLGSPFTSFEADFRPILIRDDIDDFEMPDVLVGASGRNGIWVYTPQAVNSSFTVTPQAADTVFTPASAVIDNKMSAFFNFTTSTAGNRQIYLSVSGNNGVYSPVRQITLGSLSVPKRDVFITLAQTSLVLANVTYMSVALSAPAANSLTVSFSAANVRFNVSSVTFTGATTAFTVSVQGIYQQSDRIIFTLSGPDADNHLFNEIPDEPVTVQELATFILPSDYNQRSVYIVGVESEKIPIRVSVSPIARDGITITPVAANLVFNPSSLTFSNGTEQQYFTITPSANTERSSFDTTLTWLISGTDHTLYSIPEPSIITVVYREIQKVWSDHLITDDDYTSSERHLGKTYKVWMSTNWIQKGEHVSVTPVSPFYRFKPAVLFFDGDHTRMEFEATVTGLGNGRIDYILGGKDGGYFLPIGADSFDLALRPLEIVAAVVSPSERTRASIYVADNRTSRNPCGTPCGAAPNYNTFEFSASILAQYHTHSFLIRSFVLPDEDITITPHCPHVKFSPSKLTLKAGDAIKRIDYHPELVADNVRHPFNLTGIYLEANFSTEALAPGTHQVWFELTGKDSHYYSRLPVTPMTFNLVHRAEAKDFKVSSSSFLFPSVAVVVMAAFALVL